MRITINGPKGIFKGLLQKEFFCNSPFLHV